MCSNVIIVNNISYLKFVKKADLSCHQEEGERERERH